jgi:hypothetical protein
VLDASRNATERNNLPTPPIGAAKPLSFALASSIVHAQRCPINGAFMNSFTLSSVTLACSGPGAAAFIKANTVTGFTHAAFGFILLLATVAFYFLRKKKGVLIVVFSAAVLALHPAWTISAMIGDCGMSMVSMAKYATGALGAGFLLQLLLWFAERLNQRGA